MGEFEKYWEENASKESWANKAVAAKIWRDKQAKIDELQERIDKALEKAYTGIRKQGGDYYLELVEGILKGESNE